MNLQELAHEHQLRQLELIKKNAKPPRNKEELLTALRHGLAGWALCEATEQQIMDTIDRNRTSPNN